MAPFLGGHVRQPERAATPPPGRRRPRWRTPGSEVAALLGAQPGEVVFTAGGTEADNLAVKGAAAPDPRPPRAATASSPPRSSTRACSASCDRLGARGLPGRPTAGAGAGCRRPRRARRGGRRPHRARVGDARQQRGRHHPAARRDRRARARAAHRARCSTPTRCRPCRGSTSPRGRGRRRPGRDLGPQVRRSEGRSARSSCAAASRSCRCVEGGGQERGLRSGTPNVAGVVGHGRGPAASPCAERVADVAADRRAPRPAARRAAARTCPTSFENGDPRREGRRATRTSASRASRPRRCSSLLDRAGVCAAAGSSCSSGATEPSHVLAAMGVRAGDARSSIRLSLGFASSEPTSTSRSPSIPPRWRSSGAQPRERERAGARRDERRRRLVGRGRAPARAGPRRHRGHAEALGWRVRLRVLQRGRRRGRPPGRRTARHARTTCSTSPTTFDDAVVEPYVATYAAGAHAQPVRRVQPDDQVRRAAPSVRRRWASTRSPPATTPGSTTEPDGSRALAAGCRRGQGPVVRALHARAARARAHPPPGRRADQGRGARPRGAPRAAHRDQGREHGRVLHHPRRTTRVPRRAHRRRTPVRSSTPTARRSARTTASPRSRSASAVVSAWRRVSAATSSTSTRRTATVTLGDAQRPVARLGRAARSHVRRRVTRRTPTTCTVQTRAHGAPVAATLDGDTRALRDAAAPRRAGPGGRALRGRRAARRRDRHLTAAYLTGSARAAAARPPCATSRRGGPPRP